MTADAIGGVWTYALELVRSFGQHGIRVALATMGDRPDDGQRAEASELPNLTLFESDFHLEWMEQPWADVERAGKWLLELEKDLKPDLIHLNGYVHASLPWHAPTLVVGHSCVLSWWQAVKGKPAPVRWSRYRREVQRGLRKAGLVVAPTGAMLSALHAHYELLRDGCVIPNGRDYHAFQPGEKEPLILAAGRLGDDAKNIATLGAIAARLPWTVAVAGHEVDASGHSPVEGKLQHLGYLPRTALAKWVARASIYCLPARYEPFGLSILEAALSGCALVLGDIPSLRELWGGAALFVDPCSPEALYDTLCALIESPERCKELSGAARARAASFTPEKTANGYLRAYSDLLCKATEGWQQGSYRTLTTGRGGAMRFFGMDNSTQDKIEGALHEAKGKVKEVIGQATNNPELQDEGTAEKVGGKVQGKAGDVEKVFEQ